YDPNLNAARPNGRNLSSGNPLRLEPDCSLVSTVSTPEATGRTQLQTAAILTILGSPASEEKFRPAYCGTDKTIKFDTDQLDYSLLASLLASLKPVPGPPGLSKVERYFERPWLDHIPGWTGHYQHPVENMPDYGREMSTQTGEGALMLHLNFTRSEKETLLVRYVQLGIDLYGIILDGGSDNFVNNGGHSSGRKWPILFAGLMLNDREMKEIGMKSGSYLYSDGHGAENKPPGYIHFGEDDQTFYVSDDDIYEPPYQEHTRGGFTYYGHGILSKRRDYLEYRQHHKGMPDWGIVHVTDRNQDGLDWDTAYRHWCTANSWCGYVLAAHIMGAKDLWNHNALFDYMDRFMEVELRTVGTQNVVRQTSRFSEAMWDTYRREYGPVWTITPMLKITSAGGSVTRYPKSSSFALGEEVVLSAYPDPGYEFTGWSDDLSGNENPARIIMHAHRYITANFALKK
ncbi:MAG: InlB B-repeat-containing protein, partial [Planctomycetota bacterium]